MNSIPTLSSDRICLRPWRDEDRDVFAAMNADPRVMEFFRSPLSRADSDAMDRFFGRGKYDHAAAGAA